MKRIITILIVLLIIFGYFYFSTTDTVVIGEKGNVEGLASKLRSLVQGKKFWKAQLEMANEEFSKINLPQKPSSAEMQELYKEMRTAERALDEKMKVLFTREEDEARQLRIKADSLERSAKWKVIDDNAEQERMKELEKLKVIIPLLEGKLSGSKQQ
jgi:hypothetical protein